ncbi:MAG: hypothetical protein LBP92_02920 [Deltaproteobacteria bacterium]|jgi:hypothetical protein|nr:hypothetical protein [Deltaproteobacteria bacterium]
MIGSVKQEGSNIVIYDENGNFKVNCCGYGKLLGFSSSIIVRGQANIEIYDENGNFKCTCNCAYNENSDAVTVVGDTVQVNNGSTIAVYDSNGIFKHQI